MNPRTVLITGSSRGIGLGLVKHFLQHFPLIKVIAVSTSPIPIDPHPRLRCIQQNVLDFNIDLLVDVDILINNAGIASPGHPGDSVLECKLEDILKCAQVNVMGTLNMIRQVNLSKGGLIVNISSSLGSIGKADRGNSAPYRMSKAALNMLTKCCAIELENKNIACVSVCPGWVKTDMGNAGNRSADLEIEESVRKLVELMMSLSIKDTGRFMDRFGRDIPW